MSTLHRRPTAANTQDAGGQVAELITDLNTAGSSNYIGFTKGAVDNLLDITSHVWVDHHLHPLDETARRRILDANANMASKGLRVLGVGFRLLDEIPPSVEEGQIHELEKDLVLVGMIGMIDPARPEVRRCRANLSGRRHPCQNDHGRSSGNGGRDSA